MIIRNDYPNRYYASYDRVSYVVTGWYDTWDMSSVANVPSAGDMISVTESQWNDTKTFRIPTGKGVKDGVIVDYTPPIIPIPLNTQATSALSEARTYVYNNYGILNEDTPEDWVTYIKALMLISNGKDTTSTTLPTQPTD